MDKIMLSSVYIKTDESARIVRCEGGYTTPADLSDWTKIDEGTGDRFNLCQSHYFEGGLYTDDGIPRYKLVDGAPVLRTRRRSRRTARTLCRKPKPTDRRKTRRLWPPGWPLIP